MICLVGDILTDVNLSTTPEPKMRLGGIIHAARALWAMDIEYAVAYFAPDYLQNHIENCLKEYNCKVAHRLGIVLDNPYIILIKEAKEIGDQGYEFLYRDTVNIEYREEELAKLSSYKDIFIISGSYNLDNILEYLSPTQNIYLDCANNISSTRQLINTPVLNTIFISSSSQIFKNEYSDFSTFCELFKNHTRNLILKENRGGSIWYDFNTQREKKIPCYLSEVNHSVGIGDVFDIVSIVAPFKDMEDRLHMASWLAREYASTTFVGDLKINIGRILKGPIDDVIVFEGCVLPWEVRENCHIYLAAPDFSDVDSSMFDKLEDCLSYHNFKLHRPIKENGQLPLQPSKGKRRELFNKDLELLSKCNMMIAVLPFNDPGTLIEIGIAFEKNIPIILFDPQQQAYNCMLTECPDKICTDWDQLICEVFQIYSKMHKNGII